jgi:CheY-like chemotaxis protein
VVLVVVDDPEVREIAALALAMNGYVVARAESGAAALEILAAKPTMDALFTDIVMPGMSDFELADRAEQARPELRIVYTSGSTRDLPRGRHGFGHGSLIEKPRDAPQLLARSGEIFPSS